jgi:hypothetical protein
MSDESRNERGIATWASVMTLLAAVAAPAWGAAPAASPTPAGRKAPATATAVTSIQFAPQARKLSAYTLNGRFEITTRDVTFEAPPAYTDGFNFWAGRMKGHRRTEIFQMVTQTQEPGPSGLLPFRRSVSKFNLEFEKQGQIFSASGTVERDLLGLVWEGTLDPFGNLKEKRKVGGKDNPDFALLALDAIDWIFPVVEGGARELTIGEGFKEERIMPLPTRLSIAGLEALTIKVTRDYTLKSIEGGLATFEVKLSYGADPSFKPAADSTTCAISGGGVGDAMFEVPRGVFLRSRVPSLLHLDIDAPLRPLPGHPETEVAAQGKSHIDLDILLFGQQTVVRTWGDEEK